MTAKPSGVRGAHGGEVAVVPLLRFGDDLLHDDEDHRTGGKAEHPVENFARNVPAPEDHRRPESGHQPGETGGKKSLKNGMEGGELLKHG